MASFIDYYDLLEVSPRASKEVIDLAYKALAKKYHPDTNSGSNYKLYEEKMKQINEAYEVLGDVEKRKLFDIEYKRSSQDSFDKAKNHPSDFEKAPADGNSFSNSDQDASNNYTNKPNWRSEDEKRDEDIRSKNNPKSFLSKSNINLRRGLVWIGLIIVLVSVALLINKTVSQSETDITTVSGDAIVKANEYASNVQLDSGIYSGYLENGKPNGSGKMTFTTGSVYNGQWRDGLMDGQGELTKDDGEIIKGTWEKGVLKWSETIYSPTETTKIKETTSAKGSVKIQTKPTTKPTTKATTKTTAAATTTANPRYIKYTNAEYNGDTQNGQPHGYGKLIFDNGNSIEGTWTNGKIEGYGVYRWSNGDVYEGNFANGEMNGQGKVTKADGTVIQGEWNNGSYVPPPTAALSQNLKTQILQRINLDISYTNDLLKILASDISSLRQRGAYNTSMMETAEARYNKAMGYANDLQEMFDDVQNANSNDELNNLLNDLIELENDIVST